MNKLSRVISPGAVILVVGILLVSLPAGLKAQGEAWSPVDVPGPDEHPAELIQLTEEFRAITRMGKRGSRLRWDSGASKGEAPRVPCSPGSTGQPPTGRFTRRSTTCYYALRWTASSSTFTSGDRQAATRAFT